MSVEAISSIGPVNFPERHEPSGEHTFQHSDGDPATTDLFYNTVPGADQDVPAVRFRSIEFDGIPRRGGVLPDGSELLYGREAAGGTVMCSRRVNTATGMNVDQRLDVSSLVDLLMEHPAVQAHLETTGSSMPVPMMDQATPEMAEIQLGLLAELAGIEIPDEYREITLYLPVNDQQLELILQDEEDFIKAEELGLQVDTLSKSEEPEPTIIHGPMGMPLITGGAKKKGHLLPEYLFMKTKEPSRGDTLLKMKKRHERILIRKREIKKREIIDLRGRVRTETKMRKGLKT